MSTTNHRYVLSGGPGAGKTSVLNALKASGFYCVQEVARALIKARLDAELSPRPEPVEFATSIYDADVANYLRAPTDAVSLFDRGVVDALCMLNQCGGMSDSQIASNLRRYPYNQRVLFFPHWKEIYQPDGERDQSFVESKAVCESLRSWYVRCGYRVTEVPFGTVAERVQFVRRLIEGWPTP